MNTTNTLIAELAHTVAELVSATGSADYAGEYEGVEEWTAAVLRLAEANKQYILALCAVAEALEANHD